MCPVLARLSLPQVLENQNLIRGGDDYPQRRRRRLTCKKCKFLRAFASSARYRGGRGAENGKRKNPLFSIPFPLSFLFSLSLFSVLARLKRGVKPFSVFC